VGPPTNNFQAPCFSPDGKVLAVVTDGKAVLLLDAATGKDVLPLDAHRSSVYGLSLSADGRSLVSHDRGAVLPWAWRTGRLLRRYPAEGAGGETALATVAGGKVLVADRRQQAVRVREGASGKELVRLEGKQQTEWVAVSGNGSTAALIGADGKLRV